MKLTKPASAVNIFVTVCLSNVAAAQLSMVDVDYRVARIESGEVNACVCGAKKVVAREPETIKVPLSHNASTASICAPCPIVLEKDVQVGCIAGCRHAIKHCSGSGSYAVTGRIGPAEKETCEAYGAFPDLSDWSLGRKTCNLHRLDEPKKCFLQRR